MTRTTPLPTTGPRSVRQSRARLPLNNRSQPMHDRLSGPFRAASPRVLSRVLLVSALGISVAATSAHAAPQSSNEKELGQLERQLEALQGQVTRLTRQNRELAHREMALERRLRRQGGTEGGGTSEGARAGAGTAPPGTVSAPPASTSALPSSATPPSSPVLPSTSALPPTSAAAVPDYLQ